MGNAGQVGGVDYGEIQEEQEQQLLINSDLLNVGWYRNTHGQVPSEHIRHYLLSKEHGGLSGENPFETLDDTVAVNNPDYEYKQYYFHPDHLGSSNYLTDVTGEAYQHVEYLPFGEIFLEERNTGQDKNTYLYNGKELDEATGLYYYGARYYDPIVPHFLTIDRFAEKYVFQSPYSYAANNPVRFIDVNGDSIRIQGDEKFIEYTNLNIEKIRATDIGAQMLEQLENSPKIYTITEAANMLGAEFEPTNEGGNIDYDPTPWVKKLEGGAYNGLIGLSHELTHAYDLDVGNIKLNKDGDFDKHFVVKTETNAVMFQNYITKAYNLGNTRNRYGSIKINGSIGNGEKITNFKYDGYQVSFTRIKTSIGIDFRVTTKKNNISRKVKLNKSYIPWYYSWY